MKIRVVTLGCKVNQCESASIVAALLKCDHDASEGLGPADVYILNTCSVTAEADRKSRQYIGKLIKLNPDCRIIVLGCSSQNRPENFNKQNIVAIGSTYDKCGFALQALDHISNLTHSIISDRILYDKNIEKIGKNVVYCRENVPIFDRTRSFIKIQDGCDRFCNYCIIPYLRGRSRSKEISDVINECRNCTSKELVITGIDLSYYGRDIGVTPVDMLRAIADIPARKRLGSLECEIITDDLLKVMRDGNFCPHFHLSLQSGSDVVLRSMNRRYDTKFYLDKVELIRKYFPLAGITTDIIVGFPTETDELFDKSVHFIEKCEFSDIHVFPYSRREGTLAAKKYGTYRPSSTTDRVNRLLDIKRRSHAKFLDKNIGTIAQVYVEDTADGFNVGYTPNYIKVYSHSPCGDICDLKLDAKYRDGIAGSEP